MKIRYLLSSFFVFLFFALFPGTIFGQTENQYIIPHVTPPSPESAELGKFGQYEVSYFTGLADIEIPIYEVVVRDIKVPITLKYHPSGIKVTDRAGLVGLGWSVQAGGYISRQVMSKPDERPEGYLMGSTLQTSINTYSDAGLLYLDQVYTGIKDAEPDIFSYSFGNMSGKFLFNQLDNYNKVMIPYNPVRIDHSVVTNSLTFVAYDQNGVRYNFNKQEKSSNWNDSYSTTSTWKLSSITSSNQSDNVTFTYLSKSGTTYIDVTDLIVVDDMVSNAGSSVYSSNYGSSSSITQSVFSEEQVLETIVFPQGKVKFINTTRLDGYSGQYRLSGIEIWSKDPSTGTYSLEKTVTFTQSYFQSTNDKRLKLDGIDIKNSAGGVVQHYGFEYNTDYNLPDFSSKMRDYWGYYNNKGNNTLVPRQTISWQSTVESMIQTNITIGSSVLDGREPSSTYMKAWSLKKITYPTGGWTEFEYETNQYLDGQTAKLAGGLRIAKIKNYPDASSLPVVKTFKYGSGESGYGRKNFIMNNYSFENAVTHKYQLNCANFATKRTRTYAANPSISIEPYDGSPVVYDYVTEYIGDATTNSGKTVYEYSDVADSYSPMFAIGVPAIESNHYKRGQLLKKTTYRNDGSQYTKVQEISNTYGAYSDSTKSYMGLKVNRIITYDSGGGYGMPDACSSNGYGAFLYTFYRVKTGDSKLTGTTVTDYDPNGTNSVSRSTTYQYNNFAHQQVTKSTTTGSDGATVETVIRYPKDINTGVYTSMSNLHMLSSPIEQINYVGSNITGSSLTTYKANSSSYVPDKKYMLELTSPLSSFTVFNGTTKDSHYSTTAEVSFDYYDSKGNPTQVTSRDGITTSYLWDATGIYPMAQIEGATYSQVSAQNGKVSTYSSSTLYNSLKSLVPNARINTYSYKPVIGMKAHTDLNGVTTYYEYDTFGRLHLEKDTDSYIKKRYNYNYKQ